QAVRRPARYGAPARSGPGLLACFTPGLFHRRSRRVKRESFISKSSIFDLRGLAVPARPCGRLGPSTKDSRLETRDQTRPVIRSGPMQATGTGAAVAAAGRERRQRQARLAVRAGVPLALG